MSTKYHQLTVREIIRETPDAITIVFEQNEERLRYEAGQFLTLILNIEGESVRRSYSLSTCPFLDKYPAVTVKRVVSGKASNYLNDQLKVGDTIEVMQPMGKFTTTLIGTEQRHLIMFGGGSGITPLMSIMKSVLYAEPKTKVSLIYANRNEESIIFKKQLDALLIKYDRTFKVVHILEEPSPNFPSLTGRIEPERVGELLTDLPQLPAVDTEYFICGPGGMMHNALEGLSMLEIDHNRIHKESFVAGITSPTEAKTAEAMSSSQNSEVTADTVEEDGLIGAYKTENIPVKEGQEVTVVYDGEEYSFWVDPDNTILHTALALDIDLPYSCQSGICTACMGKCTSGRVKLDEEDTLTDGELEKGYVLTCVGHPLTPNVRIEID